MGERSKSFEDLIVWQKAHALVLAVYKATQLFPKEEAYSLVPQFRRAAVSIPANIAEGWRKRGASDKARFFNIAEGSLEECRYYVILSHDLGYLVKYDLWEMSSEVGRLLHAYRQAILRSSSGQTRIREEPEGGYYFSLDDNINLSDLDTDFPGPDIDQDEV